MRILVTGGAGYVGSVVAALLVEEGHRVTVLDDLSTGHRDAVPGGADFVHVDLLDPVALDRALRRSPEPYEAVLHFAARSLVGESAQEPTYYYRHNVLVTANLVDAMRRFGIDRIVFSSTAAVYGEPDAVPVEETALAAPTNAYGGSKLASDLMLGFSAKAYGIGAVSLRYFNVAGAYGHFRERHEIETHLIPNLLKVVAGEVESAQLFGTDYPTPDGTAIRDYVHVRDLADAHVLALDAAKPGKHLICNLGSGSGFSVLEVLQAVRDVTGHPLPAIDRPRRAGDPARLVASAERAKAVLGWAPTRTDLATMVRDAYEAG